jgi:hypothetical protein
MPREISEVELQPHAVTHKPAIFWTIVALATFYCAFILPFRFPLSEPVFSAAFTAGENNRVAAITVALIGLTVMVVYRWVDHNDATSFATEQSHNSQLSHRYLWWGIAAVVAATAILGFFIVRYGEYYADEGYFLTQLRSGIIFHRTIYREFEFPYGPLLYWWPEAFVRVLVRFGISGAAAYVTSLVAMEALGIGLLFYIVNSLPVRRSLKANAFCLIAFCSVDTVLGMNYAVLRCVLPFATIVLLTKQESLRRAIVVACLGEALQLVVSPELGIAFGGAVLVYGLYRGLTISWRWLFLSLAALTGGGIFAALVGPAYFLTFSQIAKGGYNIILEPQPFILILLVALVALAPIAVARGLWRRNGTDDPATGMLLALYIATLGMLPAALSRGDPLHAFFNGVGAYLLSFVAINQASLPWRRFWIVLIAITFAATQFQELHAFRREILAAVRKSPHDAYDDPSIVPAISQAVGTAKVSFPWSTPLRMEDTLTQLGQYEPGYFCGHYGAFDQASELRRIRDMRAAEFALVPIGQTLVFEDEIDNHGIKRLLRFGFVYPARKAPFYEGALMFRELTANWVPVGTFGKYTLYHKLR